MGSTDLFQRRRLAGWLPEHSLQDQRYGQSLPDAATMRRRAAERCWADRPASLSSASSSDSGVRLGELSDGSAGPRPPVRKTFSGDSGCAPAAAWADDDWDSASDASGEYEPLRPAAGRRRSPPAPPPLPPPPPPPRSLPAGRRKDLTRHLGLPRQLSASLMELQAGTVRRKDLGVFLGLVETRPTRGSLWRRWTGRLRPERAEPVNGSLPNLARLGDGGGGGVGVVGGGGAYTLPTPGRRRAAAGSPPLLRAAVRAVQERALRAVARAPRTGEVAWSDDGAATLLSQARRGSFEAPPVLVTSERRRPAARESRLGPAVPKQRLPTPPPAPAAEEPPAAQETAAAAQTTAAAGDDPSYMTMEAVRAVMRQPTPPPRPAADEEAGYLAMDAIRRLLGARAAGCGRRRLASDDYMNLGDLRLALHELRAARGAIPEDG